MARYIIWLAILLLFIIMITFSSATLSKSSRTKKTPPKIESAGPAAASVFKRGLVTENVEAKSILQEYKAYCKSQRSRRNFSEDVLAYVTPWNNHGYDVAKLFAGKFTHLSPVWLQLKPEGSPSSSQFFITGQQDIDRHWMADVRKANPKIKIVPRVMFEGWGPAHFRQFLSMYEFSEEIGKSLAKYAKELEFNGYVLELWSLLRLTGGYNKRELSAAIARIANELRNEYLDVILVIPPPLHYGGQLGAFLKEDFDHLAPHVTAFSLMTYDYSNPQRPGPNSPVKWLRECVEALVPEESSPLRKKILLGFNFYGYDYTSTGGGSIVGTQFIDILQKHRPKIQWDSNSSEHHFQYKSGFSRHTVFFPTLHSINMRLQLAKELETSVSIWEIGQGLDYFYDLL